MACPGSVVITPDGGTSSRASAEGSIAHEIAAVVLDGRLPDAQKWLGTTMTHDGFTFEIDQQMLDAIMLYVDEARQAIGDNPYLVEQRVPIGHLTGEEGAEGTADLIIVRPDELEIRDLKFGRGVEVDADDNPQLVMYALGVLEKFADVIDMPKHVRMTIHQPRLAGPKEWVVTLDELLAWIPKLKMAARRVEIAKEEECSVVWERNYLTPTNDGCKFCPAKATCPALREETLRAIGDDFDDLDARPVDTLADDLSRVERVEAWCKAVRAEVERRLVQGIPVPGYKLVAGRRGARKWIDEQDAAAVLEQLIGADAWERSLISPTKAVKMVGKGEKADAVGNLTTQSEGKPSVAPETDARPAISVAPSADEFDNLEEEQ